MILITGANGQLGYDFQRLFDEIKEEYIATDVNDLDIIDIEKVREFVKDKDISLIINCAAYNNVDKAEDEPELCRKLNTYAPRDLAIIANEIGADYITYSTDFVFDGKKKTPYTEEDIPNPLSVYGKTKLEGEKEVFRVKPNSFVVRTSWVFGIANNNFNKQVINWSKSKDELSIVDDQISSPTYSKDLAYYSWELIKTKKYGLYHLSNDGEASKYDQAKYVLDKINWQGKLNRAKTKDFNLKAERAEYTKLNSEKLEKTINMKIPSWENGIDRFLEEKIYKKIKDMIFSSNIFKEIYAVFIAGSIGRKEKKIIDKNLNDVDFYVVAKKMIKDKKELEEKLNLFFKTRFTDISFISLKQYRRIYSKTYLEQIFYDINRGAVYLYESLKFKKMRENNQSRKYKILKRSAYIVYCTRLWCLVGPYDFDEKNGIYIKDEQFAIYQIKKAISAIIDASLILCDSYNKIDKMSKIKSLKVTKYYIENIEYYKKLLEFYFKKNKKINLQIYSEILNMYLKFGEIILKDKILFFELIKEKPYLILKKNNFLKIINYIRRYHHLKKIYKILLKNKNDYRLKKYLYKF